VQVRLRVEFCAERRPEKFRWRQILCSPPSPRGPGGPVGRSLRDPSGPERRQVPFTSPILPFVSPLTYNRQHEDLSPGFVAFSWPNRTVNRCLFSLVIPSFHPLPSPSVWLLQEFFVFSKRRGFFLFPAFPPEGYLHKESPSEFFRTKFTIFICARVPRTPFSSSCVFSNILDVLRGAGAFCFALHP